MEAINNIDTQPLKPKTGRASKLIAQQLWLADELTQEAIATAVGCTPKTLRKWAKEGDWDNLKNMYTVTNASLLQDARAQMADINTQIKLLQATGKPVARDLYVAKSILRKEIETLSGVSIPQKLQTLEEFLSFVARARPELLKTFSELNLQFINSF